MVKSIVPMLVVSMFIIATAGAVALNLDNGNALSGILSGDEIDNDPGNDGSLSGTLTGNDSDDGGDLSGILTGNDSGDFNKNIMIMNAEVLDPDTASIWLLLLGDRKFTLTDDGTREYYIPGSISLAVWDEKQKVGEIYYPNGMNTAGAEIYLEVPLSSSSSNRDLVAAVSIDGKEVASRTVGIGDGETLSYEGSSVSEKTVRIKMEGRPGCVSTDPWYVIIDTPDGTIYSPYFQPKADDKGEYYYDIALDKEYPKDSIKVEAVNYRIVGKCDSDG